MVSAHHGWASTYLLTLLHYYGRPLFVGATLAGWSRLEVNLSGVPSRKFSDTNTYCRHSRHLGQTSKPIFAAFHSQVTRKV
jgi:hypothetical protein